MKDDADSRNGSAGPSSRRTEANVSALLSEVGRRVRAARAARGMTRRILARDSGVSERYLAQLEGESGNPSLAVLARVAAAMDLAPDALIRDRALDEAPADVRAVQRLLDRLGAADLARARETLETRFGHDALVKAERVSLIGLRGAGKTTLGKRLAAQLDCPFVELNRAIEAEYGASIGELLALSGQPALRRYERRCLEKILAAETRVVISTGGGIIANEDTYADLLDRTHSVWLTASPEEHMQRVIDQGDLRPMARNPEAMQDLRAILDARQDAYGRADAALDTSGRTVEDCLEELSGLIRTMTGGGQAESRISP